MATISTWNEARAASVRDLVDALWRRLQTPDGPIPEDCDYIVQALEERLQTGLRLSDLLMLEKINEGDFAVRIQADNPEEAKRKLREMFPKVPMGSVGKFPGKETAPRGDARDDDDHSAPPPAPPKTVAEKREACVQGLLDD
jgi:hypothetical protein